MIDRHWSPNVGAGRGAVPLPGRMPPKQPPSSPLYRLSDSSEPRSPTEGQSFRGPVRPWPYPNESPKTRIFPDRSQRMRGATRPFDRVGPRRSGMPVRYWSPLHNKRRGAAP